MDAPIDANGDFKPYLQRLITIYYELGRNANPSDIQSLHTEIVQLKARMGHREPIDELLQLATDLMDMEIQDTNCVNFEL